MSDDEAARKARAKRLRKQIEEMKGESASPAESEAEAKADKPESPRDFIERRMHELDHKAEDDDKKKP